MLIRLHESPVIILLPVGGYAVALPMMRGFAGSGGTLLSRGCDLAGMGLDSARDIAAVIITLADQTQIDTKRVVVAGQSFGGWNTLALGALHPPGARGLINFVGGMRSTGCAEGDDADKALIDGASVLGGRTPLPSIWFYGDNDSLFSTTVWHAMVAHYRQADGAAELVPIGRFMDDSHEMLSHPEALPLWAPKVDAFLARIGLPSQEIYPQYLPLPAPSPSHFAALDDVSAVPRLSAQGQAGYEAFLSEKLPCAFVLTLDGKNVASHGGFDPLGRAMQICHDQGLVCHPYAVDNDVVWVPPPMPVASHFAALEDIAAVPYLTATARQGYVKFLSMPEPRAFVVAPDGGWTGASGGDPLPRALAVCQRTHSGCAAYAIDHIVVWRPSH